MTAFLLDAAAFLLRWFHVIAAMAWIGESFYFVMLDRALKAPRDGGEGIQGDLWSVPWRRLLPQAQIPARAPRHAC